MNKQFLALTIFFSVIFTGCSPKHSDQPPINKNSNAPGPKNSFAAVYDFTTPTARFQQHVYADGNGHLRMEAFEPVTQKSLVSIIDYQKQAVFTFVTGHKLVLMAPLRDDDAHPIVDGLTAALHNATDMGTQEIAGHTCQGWQYASGKIITTVWVGKDTGWIVDSQSADPTGVIKLTLLSYKAGAQDPTLFVVPKDYRTMESQPLKH